MRFAGYAATPDVQRQSRHRGGTPLRRVASASLSLAIVLSVFALTPVARPAQAAGASCVRFVGSNFDAAGNDHFNENGEWVRIKNFCGTGKSISGWLIHDYRRIHEYTFPTGARIGAGSTVTIYTGRGTDTRSKRYMDRNAAIWNNTPPEFAYLLRPEGLLKSKWTEY
jgi:competence protein ComEC